MSNLHIFVLILVIGLEARREGESSFALCTRGLSLQRISTWGKCYFLLARVEPPLEFRGITGATIILGSIQMFPPDI